MNKKYFLPLAIAAMIGASSCVKLTEDPKATLTPGNYFNTQSELDGAVTSAFRALALDGAWGFTSKMTSYYGSDDLTTHPESNKAEQREFDRLQGTSTNGSLRAEWEGPWNTIYQVNNVITNYEKVAATTPDAIQKRTYSGGQAYFLRGICYFYLVRTFGPLPIVTGPAEITVTPGRQGQDKVYAQIISDLKKAAEMLPDKWPTGVDVGRPGALAARAVLANVYLTMAGWPLNQVSNYSLSATEAKAVIDSKKFDLMADYLDVFKTNNNIESVFGLEYNVAGQLPNRSFGATCIPDDEGGWDDFFPEINYFKDAPVCKRTDETFHTQIKNNKFGLVSWDDPRTATHHPYYNKFRYGAGDGIVETPTKVISFNASTNKTTDVVRFAETLLTYAEASAMAANSVSDDAYEALNKVRRRAGLADIKKGLTAVAFRDSVVAERKYEFAGEFGQRWFDIVRLQLLPQVIARRDPNEFVDRPLNPAAVLNPGPKYLAPIPIRDLNLSPGWTQNPSY
ncbi:RagB/SusD family nutrient uptake outer membrane protein [Chitinophaga sp. RAB17]|uniref:RagB/SusD family nutrient uptake outer membrane protein n=1 Tax=Chitinophaga sp. RAB17 TaxID=3233049 RepID=UPI003F909160